MESYGDLVAAEDVLLFANAAITSTGQREFRSDAVKYRGGRKQALRHTHLPPGTEELGTFLFAPPTRRAGRPVRPAVHGGRGLRRPARRPPRSLPAARGATGVPRDLTGMPLTRPAAYVLALPVGERQGRRAALTRALRAAADRRAAGRRPGLSPSARGPGRIPGPRSEPARGG